MCCLATECVKRQHQVLGDKGIDAAARCHGGEKRSGETRFRRFKPRAAGEAPSVQGNFLLLKVIHKYANIIGDG